MPLHILQENIINIKCDAIVNAANNTLLGGGGVDGAIHRAAGPGLLAECATLGGCLTGDAKITKAYRLPCQYVIHTVGPIWQGGTNNERALLESCYNRSLALAKEYGCDTVAFPLISSGAYSYPKAQALSVAVETISKFLFDHEMTVYLVVYDRQSYQIATELYDDVAAYLDENLDDDLFMCAEEICECLSDDAPTLGAPIHRDAQLRKQLFSRAKLYEEPICEELTCDEKPYLDDLTYLLSHVDDTFAVTLLKLIDAKNMTDVECYKKANVSKQTWYKIMNEKAYKPSKNTVLCFAIALELSLEETEHLLSTVGFALSKSSKFDIIIKYFLVHGEYNIFTINQTLFEFDEVCLGV